MPVFAMNQCMNCSDGVEKDKIGPFLQERLEIFFCTKLALFKGGDQIVLFIL